MNINWKNRNTIITISAIIAVIAILICTITFFIVKHNRKEIILEEEVVSASAEIVEEEELENTIEENTIIISIDELENKEEDEAISENIVVKEEKSSNIVKANSLNRYYIKINNLANVVTIYQNDGQGNYSPVKAMVCSTGTYTPKSGRYTIKGRWEWLGLQGNVYGHYATQINGNILFHSVPYLRKYDPASLEYWEFDKLGTSASLGCVRLQIKDAKWIFDNCSSGTIVEFYSSSDPEPLGKPSAPRISSNTEYRNWDPTDPNPSNPWNNRTTIVNNNDNTGEDDKSEEEIKNIIQNTQNIESMYNTENIKNTEKSKNMQRDKKIENSEITGNTQNKEKNKNEEFSTNIENITDKKTNTEV